MLGVTDGSVSFTSPNRALDCDGCVGLARGELSPYPAVSNADEPGFFLEHGDTIYIPLQPVPVAQATTLQEYRAKQSEVYETRFGLNTCDLRTSAILATIDDHEVINDFAGGAPADLTPLWQR